MPQVEELITKFKLDIRNLSPIDIVRKHIISGDCYILTSEKYFDLRSEVAEHFNIHPNEVLVVGSGKLGFSIAPKKRYTPFGNESDIDVAIVSSYLFDQMWQAAYKYSKDMGAWDTKIIFEGYLFQGWIRPDKFPPSRQFNISAEWWEFFRVLTNRNKYGDYGIKCALYKSWYFLEQYQEICARECKEQL